MAIVLGKIRVLPKCCVDLDIAYIDLIFPERMPYAGQEFVNAHGLLKVPLHELMKGARDMGEGIVKLQHICDQLQDDGSCGVYATRPQICREFDCATRFDCMCQGKGMCQH